MVKKRGQVKTPRNTNNREVTNLQITAKNGTVADNSNKIENKVAEPHFNKITTKRQTRNKAHSVNNLGDGIVSRRMVKKRGQVKTPRNTNNREITNLQITAKNGTVADNSNKIENKVAEPHFNKITTKRQTRNKAHSVNNLGDGIVSGRMVKKRGQVKTPRNTNNREVTNLQITAKNGTVADNSNKIENKVAEPHFNKITTKRQKRNKAHSVNNLGDGINRLKHQDNDKDLKTRKEVIYTCSICLETFKKNAELKKHKKTHNETFLCKPCRVAFSEHYEYIIHMLKHNNCKSYKCNECGKVCKIKRLFKDHVATHFEFLFDCNICKRTYKSENSYKKHLRHHRTSMKCGECGKEFETSRFFDNHMMGHIGLKPYQCYYCGKGFVQETNRNIHMRVHTNEKPHECKLCLEKFRHYSTLYRHMENHDETIMKYGCHACGKKFYHSERLTRHMRTHKNLCTCTKCNKKFTDRNLEKHIKTVHVSRMIFKCDLCNVAFRTVRGLQLHSKTKLHLDAT